MSAAVIVLSNYLEDSHIKQLEALYDSYENKYAGTITNIVKAHKIAVNTGDIIQTKKDVYRNDYKVIWVNDRCVDLNVDYDEYGAVPPMKELCVLKHFPVNYWNESITHNCLVPFDHKDFKDQLLHNYTVYQKNLGISSFIHQTLTYTIYFDWEYSNMPHNIQSVLDYEGIYLYETQLEDFDFMESDNYFRIFRLTVS